MKDSNTELKSEITKTGKETKTTVVVKKFFVDHFIAGVSGFTVFFLFAIFIDFFSTLFDPNKSVNVDLFTISIGLAGFVLAFGFSFLENYKK